MVALRNGLGANLRRRLRGSLWELPNDLPCTLLYKDLALRDATYG